MRESYLPVDTSPIQTMDLLVDVVSSVIKRAINSSLFALSRIYFLSSNSSILTDGSNVVWSANANNPVRYNATLKLASERGLVLQDADGTIAWFTNIGNKSVASIHLTDTCNLMLLDENNATIWQSFDHPTDRLVLVQKWVAGQQLTSQDFFPNAVWKSWAFVGPPVNAARVLKLIL